MRIQKRFDLCVHCGILIIIFCLPQSPHAETSYSTYGTGPYNHNIILPSGNHCFVVDKIAFFKNTEWYVDGVWQQNENDYSGFFALDPKYCLDISKATQIEAVVYNSNFVFEETHRWLIQLASSGPDLIAQDITISPSSPTTGIPDTITVFFMNQGDTAVAPFFIDFRVDSISIGTYYFEFEMGPGFTGYSFFTHTSFTSGPHLVTVELDSDYRISESNELNNIREETYVWDSPVRPDLIVQNISITPSAPTIGDSTQITATIRNDGDANAEKFSIRYLIDGTSIGTDELTSGLDSRSSGNESISFIANSLGPHTVRILVDYDNLITESDEVNNIMEALYTVYPNLVKPIMRELSNPSVVSDSLDITFSVEVRLNPDSVLLYYRTGGDTSWAFSYMSSVDSIYNSILMSNFVGHQGIEYYFHAYGAGGEVTLPDGLSDSLFRMRVKLIDERSRTLSGNRWEMIGFPFEIDTNANDYLSILSDDIGAFNDTIWRIGRYNSASKQYETNNSIGSFKPKLGYWLWMFTESSYSIGADGVSATPELYANGQSYDSLILLPGWNQFSNPFPFPICWNSRVADNGISLFPFEYVTGIGENSKYDTTTLLEPYRGYWIENTDNLPRTLLLPYRSCDEVSSNNSLSQSSNSKEIHLQLESYGTSDPTNILGFRSDAKEGYDKYDLGEPPQPFGEYISLAFVQKRGDGNRRLLTGEYKQDSHSGWTYDLLLRGNTNEPAYLKLTKLENIRDDFRVYLHDLDSDLSYELELNEQIVLPQIPTIKGLEYRLIVGNKQYLEGLSLESAVMPDNYSLYQNYPNPFNPSTTIIFDLPLPVKVYLDIVNTLGQVVKVLQNRNLTAGSHSVVWDGRNESGSRVASGIYFYRIKTESYTSTKKMVLVK